MSPNTDEKHRNPLTLDTPTTWHESKRMETVEELYSALGDPGRFAVLVFLVVCTNMLTVATNHAAGVFLDYSPMHTCHAFGYNGSVVDHNNLTVEAAAGLTHTAQMETSECHTVYRSDDGENVTRSCGRGQWRYQVSENEKSSVTEWDLVCKRAGMAHLSSTLYYVGVMVGGLVFGYVSDLVGRRRAMLLALYMSVGLGYGISFTENLMVYIVLRALMGVGVQGFLTATYIRLLELFGPKYRSYSGNFLYCVWGISLNYLGLTAWILKNWRKIQIACISQGVLAIFYLWLVPESLRWLIAKGKTKEAAKLTARIYKMNKCEDLRCLDPSLIPRLTREKKTEKLSILEIFRSSILRKRTAILAYVTLAVNFGYWGLTYNTQSLVGDHYQNFIISACPEIFVYVANGFILSRFGRKRPMMFYFSVTAVCCFISCILSTVTDGSAKGTGVTVVSTIGRLAACGLMGTNDVFMAELYPTVVRNTGVGVCVCVGRFGAVITPIIFSLTEVTFQSLPLLSFGVVTFMGVVMTMLLPDTWNQDLPETLRDLEMSVQVAPRKDDLLLPSDDTRNKREMEATLE